MVKIGANSIGGKMRDTSRSTVGHLLMFLAGWLVLPSLALGQTSTAGIAGAVRDASGAVLPGVTVEAASPALIEKVRTVITDQAGQYRILELRPGTYSVTFTLPGFSVVKREGLELTTGLTATANAELAVGSLEETITVSGATPVVDVQNTATRSVLTTAVLDTLPVTRGLQGFNVLTLGAVASTNQGARDVGGNQGDWAGRMFVHGVREYGWFGIEGLTTMSILADGSRRQEINYAGLQETVINTAAPPAENEGGGVNVNLVPKEGGNTFRGVLFGDYTGERFQNNNLDADLRARGAGEANTTKYIFDVYGGLGGPILKDKLWFYTAHRWKDARQDVAGVFYNKLQGQSPLPAISSTLFYEPDLSRPAYVRRPAKQYYHERFTWQAAARHKITLLLSEEDNCACPISTSSARSPEASWWGYLRERHIQPGWTYTATNRLLVEAAFNRRKDLGDEFTHESDVSKTDRSMMDVGLGTWYGSLASGNNPNIGAGNGWLTDYGSNLSRIWAARAAVSYVSGSHAFKTGVSNQSGWINYGPGYPNFAEAYQFRNRVPSGLWQLASPGLSIGSLRAQLGLFAQDQWTTGKMTLNLGVRFDYLNAYAPEMVRPAGAYTPELHFDEVPNLPNWKDINPRVGVAYDLFGNGRTALKGSIGRYVVTSATRIARDMNPADQIAGTVFRTWADANGDFVPNCDLKSPLANGECGAMANQRFGTAVPTLSYAGDYLNGWGNRGFNWQGSVTVQHELTRGLAVNAGYFRTLNRNIEITDNLAITPSDYDPYCITAPVDARLPGGGGNQICGLYDIKPEKFGLVDNQVRASAHVTDSYNGLDLGMNARFGQGGTFFGGVSVAKDTVNGCFVVDTPDLRFCKTSDAQSQIKLAGSYPLPWRMQASATFQNLPGINQLASLVVTNAQIASSLGRNVGACRGAATCTATVNVPLIQPGTMREPRQNQLDVRLSKQLRVGGVRIDPKFEVFNALNANDPQGLNATYGARWLFVSNVLAGRLFKFGAQVNF